jgi:glutathione synthase/RimK-type ligase-like ATP-grasp enzyme
VAAAGANTARLLLVVGSDALGAQRADGKVRISGNSDLYKLLPSDLAFKQLNLAKQRSASRHLHRQDAVPDLSRFDCVVNLVTDPDQNPKMLDMLRRLLRGYGGRVVNRPDAVVRSTRDQVARRLSGIDGLRVPATLRLRGQKLAGAVQSIERAGLSFPAILRRAGTHGGSIVGRIESQAELAEALQKTGDFILTEFADFQSADGLYRKYRVFFFGDRWVFRHMIAADQWNIHARERVDFMAHRQHLLDEEAVMFRDGAFTPAVRKVLDAVAERMEVDFFGMDFGIDRDGRVVLFEANATMNFFPFLTDPKFDYVRACVEPSQRAFLRLLGVDEA